MSEPTVCEHDWATETVDNGFGGTDTITRCRKCGAIA